MIYKQKPRRDNSNNGNKAHNDDKLIKVGRINYNSWATKKLKAADIFIYESVLVHIKKFHSIELNKLGMTPLDYTIYIVKNYNEIYKGSGTSNLLVVKRTTISNFAAIELSQENGYYKIKTAALINNKQLSNKKLLCAKDHYTI